TSDDAAVYRIDADRALVATVDFFTPIVDEPYDFGQIAAANALSDSYAMGARPLFALNVVSFPRNSLGEGVLGEVGRGGGAMARPSAAATPAGHWSRRWTFSRRPSTHPTIPFGSPRPTPDRTSTRWARGRSLP